MIRLLVGTLLGVFAWSACAIVGPPLGGGGVGTVASGPCIEWAHQCTFVTSLDSMKLSKDQESNGLTDAQIDNAVAAIAAQHPTHITVVTHYDLPNVAYQWVKAIRAHGAHVWFRSGVRGWGNGTISPSQWLTTFHQWVLTYANNAAYPGFVEAGDILDVNAETENGFYKYCACDLYGSDDVAHRAEFNTFLLDQTATADDALRQRGFTQGSTNAERDVLTTVHSVDPGTLLNILSPQMVAASEIVTIDAYPDQSQTDPATAASKWLSQLSAIHAKWPNAKILIGEMGYSNTINVADGPQRDVIAAEMRTFSTTSLPLHGLNYWVGPGAAGDGGYTHVLVKVNGVWAPRPAAACLRAFFEMKAGGGTALC